MIPRDELKRLCEGAVIKGNDAWLVPFYYQANPQTVLTLIEDLEHAEKTLKRILHLVVSSGSLKNCSEIQRLAPRGEKGNK